MQQLGLSLRCRKPVQSTPRFLPWTQAVEEVLATIYYASKNAVAHRAVDPNVPWAIATLRASNQHVELALRNKWTHTVNALGTECGLEIHRCLFGRTFATVGNRRSSGSVRILYTHQRYIRCPWTSCALCNNYCGLTGLSCQSGSFLTYALVSTLIWVILSFLARLGKTLAALNASPFACCSSAAFSAGVFAASDWGGGRLLPHLRSPTMILRCYGVHGEV